MKTDASSSIPQNKNNYAERKEAEKQRRKLQNAVERLEKNIAEAEEKLSQLEAQLAVVDYSDASAAEALIRTHANAKTQLDQLYADWESAGEALMAFDKEEQG